ncbi:MAG: tRNA pseudouridine(13) synthase TruD [Candidatus Woesearchaeota archaeon]|nr:tRNA pseudouridine(13) synthase TruD [Candidatus Woesearchaeota archaeon]
MYIIKQIPQDFIVEEKITLNLIDGPYTYFSLEKKEYNTEDAIQKLSEHFKIPRKEFGFCGNKDRNAVTKQFCSVKGRIHDLNLKDLKITIIGNGIRPISLGDLDGNKFSLVVRNLETQPRKINQIPNYFDEQRFGTHNLEIGLMIIRKRYKEACTLLDYDECKNHLAMYPTDYVGAIRKAPFSILKMFIHSVQSYLWNEAASELLRTYKHHEISYNQGVFVFPKEPVKNIIIPLVSFDTEFGTEIKEIYEKILLRNKIDARDFIIRAIPNITPKGNDRELMADVNELSIGKLEDDDLNTGKKKIMVSFELGKGSYATIVIREMFN